MTPRKRFPRGFFLRVCSSLCSNLRGIVQGLVNGSERKILQLQPGFRASRSSAPWRPASGASPRRTVAEGAQSLYGQPAAPSPAPTRPSNCPKTPLRPACRPIVGAHRIGSRPKMPGFDDLRPCGSFDARCQPRPGHRASASEPCAKAWGSPCRKSSGGRGSLPPCAATQGSGCRRAGCARSKRQDARRASIACTRWRGRTAAMSAS